MRIQYNKVCYQEICTKTNSFHITVHEIKHSFKNFTMQHHSVNIILSKQLQISQKINHRKTLCGFRTNKQEMN